MSWTIRCGELPVTFKPSAVGSRLWLYANFDCNLSCDYCCVRSSPRAPRRELVSNASRGSRAKPPDLNVAEIFVTGGEPFLLPDIAASVAACAAVAPTTLLTNGMLFNGRRLDTLRLAGRSASDPSDQSRQPDTGTARLASWRRDLGSRLGRR